MALTVGKFKHLAKQIMGHVNTINDALTALTTKVGGGLFPLTDAAEVAADAHINNVVTMDNAGANTYDITDALAMVPGDEIVVIQIGAGATSITVSETATLNGAQADIAVGGQWSRKVITCIAADTYNVAVDKIA